MVESPVTHNKASETQISLLAQTPLGPSPERHANVVTTSSEKQIENPKESDNNEVDESSCKKRVKIEKIPPTPREREVVKEMEKETPYVVPPYITH